MDFSSVFESCLFRRVSKATDKFLHKLDLLEDLKTVEGKPLELVKTDYVLRRLIIHVDLVVRVGAYRTSSTFHELGLAIH